MTTTKTPKKRMHIGWFSGIGLGPGPQTWADDRRPESLRFDRPDEYIEMIRVMERGGVDFLLFADSLGIPDQYKGTIAPYIENAQGMPKLDPAVIAPILAAATSSIGIIPTMTTLYYPPHLLARLTASLDHVTGGRIGWNIVTAGNYRAAQNFGHAKVPIHDLRYDMSDDYLAAVHTLWSSWDRDAIVEDAESGVFADPDKVHWTSHDGDTWPVRGPLNVVPSPQGHPFLVQAGSSPRGIKFAGEHAEAVIANCRTVEDMKTFRESIRESARAAGRNPDSIKVFFNIAPRIAETRAGADVEHFNYPGTRLEQGLAQLSQSFGDMSKYEMDEPLVLREEDIPAGVPIEYLKRTFDGVTTLRQHAMRLGNMEIALPVRGSAIEVANQLEEVFDEVGGDGFMIRGQWIPEYVNDVCIEVLGQLTRRGRVAPPVPGTTLRQRLGTSLERTASTVS